MNIDYSDDSTLIMALEDDHDHLRDHCERVAIEREEQKESSPAPMAMHIAPWSPPWSTISGVAAYGWLIAAIGAHLLGMPISCGVCVGIAVLLGAYAYRWRALL
jgi:hypothetical protein